MKEKTAASDTNKVVLVLHDYDSQDPVELTIREGDIIDVITEDQSGWWKGLLLMHRVVTVQIDAQES